MINDRVRATAVSVFALFVLVSCAFTAAPPAESDVTPLITMKRVPGWRDPSYQIQIFATGLVIYVGLRNVRVLGEQTTQLEKPAIQQLLEMFEKVKFCSLGDKYIVPGLEDSPILELTINCGSKAKTVRLATAINAGPSVPVKALGLEIDRVVDSGKWVKTN